MSRSRSSEHHDHRLQHWDVVGGQPLSAVESGPGYFVSESHHLEPLAERLGQALRLTAELENGDLLASTEGVLTTFDPERNLHRTRTVDHDTPFVDEEMEALGNEYGALCENPVYGQFFQPIGSSCNPVAFPHEDGLFEGEFGYDFYSTAGTLDSAKFWIEPDSIRIDWTAEEIDDDPASPNAEPPPGFTGVFGDSDGDGAVDPRQSGDNDKDDPSWWENRSDTYRCKDNGIGSRNASYADSDFQPVLRFRAKLGVDLDVAARVRGATNVKVDEVDVEARLAIVPCDPVGAPAVHGRVCDWQRTIFQGFRPATPDDSGDVTLQPLGLMLASADPDDLVQKAGGVETCMLDNDLTVTPWACTLWAGIPGCPTVQTQVKKVVNDALAEVTSRFARLLRTLLEPPQLAVPAGRLTATADAVGLFLGVCDDACTLRERKTVEGFLRLTQLDLARSTASVEVPGGPQTVAISGPGGSFTNDTLRLFSFGGSLTSIAGDHSEFLRNVDRPDYATVCPPFVDADRDAVDDNGRPNWCLATDLCRACEVAGDCPEPLETGIDALAVSGTFCNQDSTATSAAERNVGVVRLPVPEAAFDLVLQNYLDDEQMAALRSVRDIPASPSIAPIIEAVPMVTEMIHDVLRGPLPDGAYYTNARVQFPEGRSAPPTVRFDYMLDADLDGVDDHIDNCSPIDPRYGVPNAAQTDTDGDGWGDACDLCRDVPSTYNRDLDGDGVGDDCDCDIDGDGCGNPGTLNDGSVCGRTPGSTTFDQEPERSNPRVCPSDGSCADAAFADFDGDGQIDHCDGDDDDDGVVDGEDICPIGDGDDTFEPTVDRDPSQTDSGGLPAGDVCDPLCSHPDAPGCGTTSGDGGSAGIDHDAIGGGRSFQCLRSPRACGLIGNIWPRCAWVGGCPDDTGESLVQLFTPELELVTQFPVTDLGLEALEPDAMTSVPDMDGDELRELVIVGRDDSADRLLMVSAASGKLLTMVSWDRDALRGAVLTVDEDRLFVGIPNADGGRGRVEILNAATGKQLNTLFGEEPEAHFGSSLVVARPREGGARLLVGAPGVADGAGAVHLYEVEGGKHTGTLESEIPDGRLGGSPAGLLWDESRIVASVMAPGGGAFLLFAKADGDAGYEQSLVELGGAADSWRAMPLAWLTDMDGDGLEEVAVGTPWSNGGRGSVQIVSQWLGWIDSMSGEQENQGFGVALSVPGDLDEDGVPELFVASTGGAHGEEIEVGRANSSTFEVLFGAGGMCHFAEEFQ